MAESESVELNCNLCREMLDAFHDMELTTGEAQQVEAHLEHCAACRDELSEIEHVVESLRNLPPIEMNRDLSDIIESKILAAKVGQVKEDLAYPQQNLEQADISKPATSAASGKVVSMRSRWLYLAASAAAILALFAVMRPDHSAPLASAPSQSQSQSHSQSSVASAVKIEEVRENANTQNDSQEAAAESKQIAAKDPRSNQSSAVAVERKMLLNAGNKAMASADLNDDHVSDGDEVVALFGEHSVEAASETGLSTNEDGLYAIKL